MEMETLKNILATIFITAVLIGPIVLFTVALLLEWVIVAIFSGLMAAGAVSLLAISIYFDYVKED